MDHNDLINFLLSFQFETFSKTFASAIKIEQYSEFFDFEQYFFLAKAISHSTSQCEINTQDFEIKEVFDNISPFLMTKFQVGGVLFEFTQIERVEGLTGEFAMKIMERCALVDWDTTLWKSNPLSCLSQSSKRLDRLIRFDFIECFKYSNYYDSPKLKIFYPNFSKKTKIFHLGGSLRGIDPENTLDYSDIHKWFVSTKHFPSIFKRKVIPTRKFIQNYGLKVDFELCHLPFEINQTADKLPMEVTKMIKPPTRAYGRFPFMKNFMYIKDEHLNIERTGIRCTLEFKSKHDILNLITKIFQSHKQNVNSIKCERI